MLKRFFVSMLGTIAGFWVALAIGFFALLGIAGALISNESSKTKVEKGSVLYLNLTGPIVDRNQAVSVMQLLQEGGDQAQALVDIVDALDIAAKDSNIEGLYINASGSSAGFATRQEIIEAIKRFKAHDKWVWAYADSYTQGDYLLASGADRVAVNPQGSVYVQGLASQVPFFTGLLDKLGVKMQIVRVGTFKSAVEPFFSKEMSSASRLQTQVMIDSLWRYYSSTVAEARKVTITDVNRWADSLMSTQSAEYDLERHAVTEIAYRREIETALREELDLDDDDELPLVTPAEYIESQKKIVPVKHHVAVYFASGDIVDSGDGGIAGDVVTPDIIKLANDDKVDALLLRVNSGGGSAFASEQIWEALEYFKSKGKPFYVSMGDYAASGGYYISCGADRIFADRTTLTGSIGVFGMIPDVSGLVTGKLGVNFSTVESNPNAAFPSATGALNADQLGALQASVERMYDTFTSRVAAGRGISQDSVKAIAEGRVWVGGDALRLGLVDELGSMTTALKSLASKVDLEPDKVVYYPEVKDEWLLQLMAEAKKNVTVGTLKIDSRAAMILSILAQLQNQNHMQARMMPIEIQ